MSTQGILVRYIALDDELERIKLMEPWIRGLEGERVPGVLGSLGCSHYDEQKRLNRFGFPMSTGEIGCFLAHRECWQESLRANLPILVLESDVAKPDIEKVKALLPELVARRKYYDVVRLHGLFPQNDRFRRSIVQLSEGRTLCQTFGDAMGAAAYIVTPEAAAGLLGMSDSFFVPVDVFLAETWRHRLRFRTVWPYVFELEPFPTVIGQRRRPKQTKLERLRIECSRAKDDLRRVLYLPRHYFR